MYHEAKAYVVKKEGGTIIMTGGLFCNEDQDTPQIFEKFTEQAYDNSVLHESEVKMKL